MIVTRFTITAQHLTLMRRMVVEWQDCETGAPAINPKRPYGNSDVAFDVLEILDVIPDQRGDADRYWPAGYPEWSDTQRSWALALHKETETALQICLVLSAFEAGDYQKVDEYDYRTWRRIGVAV